MAKQMWLDMRRGRDSGGLGPPSRFLIKLAIFLELILISSSSLVNVNESFDAPSADSNSDLDFTSDSYNATINENSVGKVYVESQSKMGIYNEDPDIHIKYKIVDGDPESFFKAESEQGS